MLRNGLNAKADASKFLCHHFQGPHGRTPRLRYPVVQRSPTTIHRSAFSTSLSFQLRPSSVIDLLSANVHLSLINTILPCINTERLPTV